MTTTTPRPPEGDWLGTPYLRFTREGPFSVCTLDRPEARNAMTPAKYFGIRYAIRHVDADPDRDAAPVGEAGGVGGQRAVPGWRTADRALQRYDRGQRSGDFPGTRVAVRHRRHLLQPDAGAADRAGAHPGPDVHRPDPDGARGARVGHGRPGGAGPRLRL